jgi:4-hydroxybenzoate polyprenyltransferase
VSPNYLINYNLVTDFTCVLQFLGCSHPITPTVGRTLQQSFTINLSVSRFIIYPLLKRITYWPQAWLGIAMNFGFVVSWVGITGRLDARDVNLYMLSGCWW